MSMWDRMTPAQKRYHEAWVANYCPDYLFMLALGIMVVGARAGKLQMVKNGNYDQKHALFKD